MAYWLTYVCADCDEIECTQCTQSGKAIIRMVRQTTRPPRSFNGPCPEMPIAETTRCLLGLWARYFYFDEVDGYMRPRMAPDEPIQDTPTGDEP
jgi:hypothetical protein